MSLFDKKHLVSPADALPGRNTPMPVATLHAVNGHSMTNVPDGMEIAIFAMGCFWGWVLFWAFSACLSSPLKVCPSPLTASSRSRLPHQNLPPLPLHQLMISAA